MEKTEIKNEESNMFDDFSDNDDEQVQVARPTTKPTDRTKQLAKVKYAFMTDEDKEKLNTFPQFTDPSHIAPKKLDGQTAAILQDGPTLAKKGSAWNKAGTTW